MSPLTREILEQLIARYERPLRQNVARVRLNERQHPAYFSQTDVRPRDTTHQELQPLAQRGIVTLHWKKWETGNWLEAVDVTRAEGLYALLKHTPRSSHQTALQELLGQQTPHAEWHTRFLEWAIEQLKQNRSPAPLLLQEASFNRELLIALDAIAQLSAPILERGLSVRIFADSKRLASLRGPILTVLRRFDTNAALYVGDDSALLRAHYVERAPEYVPLAGAIRLAIGERQIDLTPFAASVALPANLLRTAKLLECDARAIITVENLSSFNELVNVRPPDMVVLYIGGFASPSVITFLKSLRAMSPNIPLWHWGDIDVGGLRILAHLRANLDPVLVAGMDTAVLTSHRAFARPLTVREQNALQELTLSPWLRDCIPLIDKMLQENLKLEQEAVLPKNILHTLAEKAQA